MVERLKRWESPRKQGRNDQGKGGTATRQLRKREQMLRQKLKNNSEEKSTNTSREGREIILSLF